MVSRIITLKALTKLTGIDDLNVFHKVILVNGKHLNDPSTFSPDKADAILSMPTIEMKDEEPNMGPNNELKTADGVKECYLICSKSEIALLHIDKIREKSFREQMSDLNLAEEAKAKSQEDLKHGGDQKLVEIEETLDIKETNDSEVPGLLLRFPLTAISNVWTHSILADRFALAIDRDTAAKLEIPSFLALSSCHRKEIIEDLQISHDTAMISFHSKLSFLKPAPLPLSKPSGWPEFRHPTIMMFNTIPNPLKVDMQPFYRCGYLFLGPKNMEDTSQPNEYNRHSCTYTFPSNDAGGGSPGVDKKKHLMVRMMPKKPIRSSLPDSNLNFHLWVESIGWAIAQNEVAKEDTRGDMGSGKIFIPERGVYRKKMNITEDESMYHCFRLHIYTPTREIGVIGVRRKYIPPLIDTFQDMIFVLKGASKGVTWHNETGFMQSLERIVDTLSPSAMDWRRDSYWAAGFKKPPEASHPTYLDKFIIQMQADALLCNYDVYSWLRNREKFKTNGLPIVPRMKFNGKECYLLAEQFCRSACKALYDGQIPVSKTEKGGQDSKDSKDQNQLIKQSVEDPISIVKRFEASAEVMLNEQDVSPQVKKVLLNNWRMRVSKYFAHVVDCYMPDKITIVTLAKVAARKGNLGDQNQRACDKVLAFLLYMHKRGGVFVQPETSVLEQMKDADLMSKMECNETVMLKLLSANYFESLSDGKDSSPLTALLSNLLYRKSNNLDITRAVCRKIRRKNSEHNIALLIKPLLILVHMGNAYAQTYAFQALVTVAKVGQAARKISKGVGIAMHVVYTSPSRELVQAAVTFLETIVAKNISGGEVKKMSKIYFLQKLKDLLSTQILKQRHDASLLSAVATLIMRICQKDHHILFYMVVSGVIKELVAIISDHKDYYRILIPISACLGTIFYQLKCWKNDMKKGSENAREDPALISNSNSALMDHLQSQAQVLVTTLKRMMNPEGLQVSLNILIVLKHMVNLLEGNDRTEALKDLNDNYALEHVLNRCRDVASRCEDLKRTDSSSTEAERRMWATVVVGVQSAAQHLLGELYENMGEGDGASIMTKSTQFTA